MVILGLGSNVGEREAHLAAAVREVSALLSGVRVSRVLESKALPPKDPQLHTDCDSGRPFLNMAVAGECALSPLALLDALKAIEAKLGRVKRGVWGPREIDIDILAMDGVCVREAVLNVPHPELLNRDFALLPLADVAPDWVYPCEGEFAGMSANALLTLLGYRLGDDLKDTGLRFA